MTQIVWLESDTPFPDPRDAIPEGLLAAGHELNCARLDAAYRKGIYPWFSEEDPVLWWSPDPRMILRTDQLHVSHSLAKKLRGIARQEHTPHARIRVVLNSAFSTVIQACAAPRGNMHGTWIQPILQEAYTDWHSAGRAHSIETWIDGTLAGGLYGVQLGRFFFGESMFSRATDASKIALVYLVRFLQAQGIEHIDCQQETSHLHSMGARPLPRADFLDLLHAALEHPDRHWGSGQLLYSGELMPLSS